MLYRLLRLRINHKRKHSSYYYTKYAQQENNSNQSSSRTCLDDLNLNLEKVVASLRVDEDENENDEIDVPKFSKTDYDYIEISQNREFVKDWYHSTLLKNELEYFGKMIDGERVVSTHGHFEKPLKACLLDMVDPTIVSEKGESHVYQILKMVSFEPEVPVVDEQVVEVVEEETVDSAEIVAPKAEEPEPEIEKIVTLPPAPKIKFKRRKYDLSNLELDQEAPIFEFKIKEDEEAHRVLAKIRELASQATDKFDELREFVRTNAPELADNLGVIYDSAWFGASLALQTLQLIIQGNLFIPEQTRQTSNAWNECDACGFSRNSRLSIADNYHLENSADKVLSRQLKRLDSQEFVEEQVEEEDFKPVYVEQESEIEYQEQQDFEEYVELTETEIMPKLGTKQVYDRESDYYYLVHYQLIHQISKLPSYLKPFADDPEYFYHSFVLFNPETNIVQVIRKGVDDEREISKLRKFIESGDNLDFNYVAFRPNKMKYCRKYYSVMMLRPSSEQSTCYVSTYTDENSKLVGWEGWIGRMGLERGIKEVHTKTNQTNNPTAISGTVIENLLKFVDEESAD